MALEDFRGYRPSEVAEVVGLFSESELRRMARAGEIPHHRGARNSIWFTDSDIREILSMTRVPVRKPDLAPVEEINPFRGTPRSDALHRARRL